METKTVQSTENKLKYLNETKTKIKEAIVAQGQTIEDSDTFRSYVDKIKSIKTLTPIHDFTDVEIFDNNFMGVDRVAYTKNTTIDNLIKTINVGDYILSKIQKDLPGGSVLGVAISRYDGIEVHDKYEFNVVLREIFEKANITTDSILGTSDVKEGKLFYSNGKKLIGSNRLYEYNTKDDLIKSENHKEGDYAIVINRAIIPLNETDKYSGLFIQQELSELPVGISDIIGQDGQSFTFTVNDSKGSILTMSGSTSISYQDESDESLTTYETTVTFTCEQPNKPKIEIPIDLGCNQGNIDAGDPLHPSLTKQNYNQPIYSGYVNYYTLLETPLRLADFKSIGGDYDKIITILSALFQGITFQNQDAYIYLNNSWVKIDSNTETEKELKAKITSLEKELNELKTSLNSISNTIDEISGETV